MKKMSSQTRAAKRILYIEDHEDSRIMLAAMLEFAGYDVITAETVDGGASLARLEHFDLYVLDSRFQDGTGIELCHLIRAFDPHTPIIFYSSAAYDYDIKAGLNAGAQYYLTKPEGIYYIERTIAKLFEGKGKVRVDAIASSNVKAGCVKEGTGRHC